MNRRRRFWVLFVPLCVLAAVVPAAVVYWRHTVPLAECSEVYRQYRHQPGVRAAFIRQMPINDTLRLDMTLLEAEDSAAFAALLLKMGKSEEYINYMFDSQMKDEDRFTGMLNERTVIAIFPSRKAIALFETENKEQQMILLIGNIKQTIKITQHEKSS